MQKKKILHLASNSHKFRNKFVPDYQIMVNNNLKDSKHSFLYIGDDTNIDIENSFVVKHDFISLSKVFKFFNEYDILVFHSLPKGTVLLYIYIYVKLFFKGDIFLYLWGGELTPPICSLKDKMLFKITKDFFKIVDVISGLETDFYLSKHIYKHTKARWFNACGTYPSNALCHKNNKRVGDVNILIGSSSFERNNHFKIIDVLSKLSTTNNVNLFIPLSYGDVEYGDTVCSYVNEKLSNYNINIMRDFMDIREYTDFLSTIDIAIFAHKGQQAMGNIRNLLGFGSVVYLDVESDSFKFLNNLGFNILNYKEISNMKRKYESSNVELANKFFNIDTIIKKQKEIFES